MKHNYSSRFLKLTKEKGGHFLWEEISDQMARDKVSHALHFAANSANIITSSSSITSSSISSSISHQNQACHMSLALGNVNKADDHGFITTKSTTDETVPNLKVDLIFQRQQENFETMCLEHDDCVKAANTVVNANVYNTVICKKDKICSEITKYDNLLELLNVPFLSRSSSTFPPRPPELMTLQSNDIDAMMREPLGMEGDLAILSHLNLLHSMSIR